MKPLKELVGRLDELRADIHAILQMHWLEHRTPDGWAVIKPIDVLNYRDKALWRGEGCHKDLKLYSDALHDALMPKLEGYSGLLKLKTGKSQETITQRFTGPVWHSEITEIPALPGLGRGLIQEVRYQPNLWLQCLLEPYRIQLMRVLPAILHFDPYRQARQKRLGYYLLYMFRVNRGRPVKISMKALLQGAHIDIRDSDERNPERFIKRIESAIVDLCDESVVSDHKCTDTNPLPRKGKLRAWLKRQWVFTPSDDTSEELAKVREKHETLVAARRNELVKKQENVELR